jgi:hypothetical protein
MNFGSTAKNINFLTILVAAGVCAGMFNLSMFTLPNILITIT